jgi:CRP-like cAMP-binding protein
MESVSSNETSEPIVPLPSALSEDPTFIAYAQQMLGDSELADGLSAEQLAQIAAIGEVRVFEEGDLICDEHTQGHELYIIGSGSVDVWLDPSSIGDDQGDSRRIASLHAGQTCGELALLDGGVRSAQLRAGSSGARLIAFDHKALIALCEANTAIGYRIMRNLAAALALRLRLHDMQLYSKE